MEHQAATKTNQAERPNQSSCCAKADSSGYESVSLFRDLHQRIGNRAVGRIVQAKLNISEPGDAHEQEADRVADEVMRMTVPGAETPSVNPAMPRVQPTCNACAEEEELHRQVDEAEEDEELIQRAAVESAAGEISSGVNNLSGGQPL